jgi:hypothetical protein
MNISQLNSAGGVHPVAAGQIHHTKGVHHKSQVQTSDAVSTDPTQTSDGITHPRLAAYANQIDARLSLAMEAKDLSPRQRDALQAAQSHFHSMIQRLDDAYSNSAAPPSTSMADALNSVLDQLAGAVNHIQSAGKVDTTG